MLRRLATRVALPALLVLTLLVTAALPSASQELPTLEDLTDEVSQIPGLDQASPVLGEVTQLIQQLVSQVEDVLGEVPVVNALDLDGEDVIEAGVAFSQTTFPDGADTAVLTREDLFADGFSSGAFQGVFDAPLLFTDSDDLDPRTGLELQRLGMENISLLGGEDALHPLVVQKLEIAGLTVNRIGGATRVETSVLAAQATNPDATTALLTRAYPDEGQPDDQAYADLLAAGPWAAENGWPVLMSTSDQLHPAVAQYLETGEFNQLANGQITDVVIIGGTNAISQAVEDAITALGINVRRVAGTNRFDTAVQIAEERGFTDSGDTDQLILAESGGRDDVWGDGFAATAYGDANTAPVLLTDGVNIPTETLDFVMAGIPDNLLDGGPAVICANFVDDIACQAIALLMVGDIEGAIALIEGLIDIILTHPLIGQILEALGLQDLLPEALQGLFDTLMGAGALNLDALLAAIAAGDTGAVEAALGTVLGALGDGGDIPLDGLDLDALLGGLTQGDLGDTPLDDVLGGDTPLEDVVGGLLGGGDDDGGLVDGLLGGGDEEGDGGGLLGGLLGP